MADKLSKQEKQRLKEKARFERERAKWKKQEARARTKKTRKKDRTGVWIKAVAVLVAVTVVLGFFGIYGGSYGIPARFLPALTVGSQNVLAPEWALNFSNLYRSIFSYGMYYGLDTNSSLFGQTVQGTTKTWDQTFRSQVHQSLQNEIALYTEAKKAGYQLSGEDKESLDKTMQELADAALTNAMSVNAYLGLYYLPGITKAKFRAMEERKLVVQGFVDQKQAEFRAQHSAEEIKEKYDADPSAYNQVDYRIYAFAKEKVEPIEGESEADAAARQKEADGAALAKANDFLKQGGTEAGFIAAAQALYDAQNPPAEDGEAPAAAYDADAATLNLRKRKAQVTETYGSEGLADWFFGAARAAGDTTAWETDSSVYAVLLVRPSYAQTTVDFYDISVAIPADTGEEPAEGAPTPQEQAKQSADALLAKWEENGGTREAFAALAAEQASAAETEEGKEPGLSEKMAPGDSGIAELDAWVFDPARKAGDAAVIQASGSYKVVYLAALNAGGFTWQGEIADELVEADYTAYVEGLHEQYPLGYHGIGMRFAMADAKALCDAYMAYARQQQSNNISYDYY